MRRRLRARRCASAWRGCSPVASRRAGQTDGACLDFLGHVARLLRSTLLLQLLLLHALFFLLLGSGLAGRRHRVSASESGTRPSGPPLWRRGLGPMQRAPRIKAREMLGRVPCRPSSCCRCRAGGRGAWASQLRGARQQRRLPRSFSPPSPCAPSPRRRAGASSRRRPCCSWMRRGREAQRSGKRRTGRPWTCDFRHASLLGPARIDRHIR